VLTDSKTKNKGCIISQCKLSDVLGYTKGLDMRLFELFLMACRIMIPDFVLFT